MGKSWKIIKYRFCKCVQEKLKTENYIDEELEKSESDSDSNNETEPDIDNDG